MSALRTLVCVICLGVVMVPVGGRAQEAVNANLLKNVLFLERSDELLPDYWNIQHIAHLSMPDLYSNYSVDETVSSPIEGAAVLKIRNSRREFPYLALATVRFRPRLAPGTYTFSVYLKSDRPGAVVRFSPAWAQGRRVTLGPIGRKWTRVSATFDYPETYTAEQRQLWRVENDLSEVQPLLYFPDMTAYYVSAPQLERSDVATTFRAGNDGNAPKNRDLELVQPPDIGGVPGRVTARSESDSHSAETVGRLRLRSSVPVAVGTSDRIASVNHDRRILVVGGKPYFIRGMAVSSAMVPDDWYFRDLAVHGINTVFYTATVNASPERARQLDLFLLRARRAGLKAIVGQVAAGRRPVDWNARLDEFLTLVRARRDDDTIIGWAPFDEPGAYEWSDAEILAGCLDIKGLDPQRFIFGNWAYDGVPSVVGAEPRGSLSAVDIYSFSDYPFAIYGGGLSRYVKNMALVHLTSDLHSLPAHSWIQLYSGFDAWREPTPGELGFMVYLNLIHGSMYSYWDTKTSSPRSWAEIGRLNAEARKITEMLHEDAEAVLMGVPQFVDGFAYSVWRKAESFYLLAVRAANTSGTLSVNMASFGVQRIQGARSVFGGLAPEAGSVEKVAISFSPYEGKLIEFQ